MTGIATALVLAACGGASLSLSEYADQMVALALEPGAEFDAMDARMGSGNATIEDAREVLSRAVEVREEFHVGISELNPPAELTDLHDEFVDLHGRILAAQRSWAERAETTRNLEELESSGEAIAFRRLVAEIAESCDEIQARLDASADREVFAEAPWVPGDLKEVVDVLLRC
jgi:hypothetical protein